MVMKHYPPEFKADAVALYRSRPGATIAQIADDLGVNRETLRSYGVSDLCQGLRPAGLRRTLVLVDEAAEDRTAPDSLGSEVGDRLIRPGWAQAQTTMRTMAVVVKDVL